jgi:hypothetical protein
VPETLHIGAYPRIFTPDMRNPANSKALQITLIKGFGLLETSLIAMQKVVGSNSISRFASNPLHLGRSALAGENQTTPAYRLHFGH